MQIQINTDSNIEGRDRLFQQVEDSVWSELGRFSERITRVEVHLSDENSDKKSGAKDKRCMMEARIADHRPVAVTNESETMKQAIDGAAEKLKRALETTLGRLDRIR